MLKLYEEFSSVQGEGTLVGALSYFVRTHGCPARCPWCDTPETSVDAHRHRGYLARPDEVVERIQASRLHYVVLTGGEPLLQASEAADLLETLGRQHQHHITLETSGIHPPKVQLGPLLSRVSLLSLSPKLEEGEERVEQARTVLHGYVRGARWSARGSAQVKVVVSDPETTVRALRLLENWVGVMGFVFVPILQPETSKGPEFAADVAMRAAEWTSTWPVSAWVRVLPQVHRYLGVR